MQSIIKVPSLRFYFRRLLGVTLVLLGVLGDGGAWIFLLVGRVGWGLLLHLPAVSIWAWGILLIEARPRQIARPSPSLGNILQNQRTPQPGRSLPARMKLPSGWAVVAGLLGLLLFPGLGTFACSLAFGLSLFLPRSQKQAASESDSMQSKAPLASIPAPLHPLLELEALPLVDALRLPDIALKRGALNHLGRQGSREAVQYIRKLLTDPHPDVRNDAAVILFRLNHQWNQQIGEAGTQASLQPDSKAHQEHLANLCYGYACSGLLDTTSSRFYAERARDALQQATKLEPAQAELWLFLARVRQKLGEVAEAWQAIEQALALAPDNVEGQLLAIELAFSQRNWKQLAAVVGRLQNGVAGAAFLNWWEGVQPELQRRTPGEGTNES